MSDASEDKKETLLVKIFRFIVIICSLLGLGYYVAECYIKYKISPEVLVNDRMIHIDEFPFPAVTFCSPISARTGFINITRFSEDVANNKSIDRRNLQIMASLAQPCPYYDKYRNILMASDLNEDVVDLLYQASMLTNETFKKCFYDFSRTEECQRITVRSLTYLGYCTTFNMLDHQLVFADDISSAFDVYKDESSKASTMKWTLEDRYLTGEKFVKPLKPTEVGDFHVNVAINKNESSNFCYTSQGSVTVIIHMPNEIPTPLHSTSYFGFNKSKIMRISAAIKKQDESMRYIPPIERNCYFEDERQLRFFKIYTNHNCIQECIANFTFVKCGCVPFYAPRTNSVEVCKYKGFECAEQVYMKWPTIYYDDPKNLKNFKNNPCNCMPTCTDIKYSIVNDNVLQWNELNTNESLVGRMNIKFSHENVVETTNYVIYHFQNFVFDVCGLFGFSALSMFDVAVKFLRLLGNSFVNTFGRFRNACKNVYQRCKRTLRCYRRERMRPAYGPRVVWVLPVDENEVRFENEILR